MRYVSGFLYGLAAANGAGLGVDAVMSGICVFLGTVCALFAVEAIVKAEMETKR